MYINKDFSLTTSPCWPRTQISYGEPPKGSDAQHICTSFYKGRLCSSDRKNNPLISTGRKKVSAHTASNLWSKLETNVPETCFIDCHFPSKVPQRHHLLAFNKEHHTVFSNLPKTGSWYNQAAGLSPSLAASHNPPLIYYLGQGPAWALVSRTDIFQQKCLYTNEQQPVKPQSLWSNFLSNPHCRDTMINHGFCS